MLYSEVSILIYKLIKENLIMLIETYLPFESGKILV